MADLKLYTLVPRWRPRADEVHRQALARPGRGGGRATPERHGPPELLSLGVL